MDGRSAVWFTSFKGWRSQSSRSSFSTFQQTVPADVLDALQYDLSRDDSDSQLGCGSPPRSLGHSQPGLQVSHEVVHLWVSEDRSRRTRRRVRRVQNDSDSDSPLMQRVSPPEPRSRVGQRRVVLVPQDSEGTPSRSRTGNRPPKCQAPLCRRCLLVRLLVNSAQPVPSAQVISGPVSVSPEVPEVAISGSEANADSIHALGADEARDAVSDTLSVEHDSDLRSVVPV